MNRRILAIGLSLLIAASAAGAQELSNGRMRVRIDPRNGSFTVHYMADVVRRQFVALLDDKEARTSFPTLYLDQRAIRLGEAPEFRVSVSTEQGAALISYRSSTAVVRQRLDFTTSPGAATADGIAVSFEIENISDRDMQVGLRYLLDTWLGERDGSHFVLPNAGVLAGETLLAGDFNEGHIVSPGSGAALYLPFSAPATRPDRVVAANWKRLSDAAWTIEVNASRGYTLMPYSINDSALALYFEPQALRRGERRSVAVILSAATPGAYATAARPADASPTGTIAIAPNLDIMADLITARKLLEALNAALAAAAPPGADELAAFEALLKRLEERKAGY